MTHLSPKRGPRRLAAQALEPGFWVVLTLRPGAAPARAYVGQVQAVDANGVRVTLVDWRVGKASSWDFYAPWEIITSALIATPEHDIRSFGEAAADWQQSLAPKRSL